MLNMIKGSRIAVTFAIIRFNIMHMIKIGEYNTAESDQRKADGCFSG